MGGMAAARMADEIGHVGFWARLARVALRVGSAMVEGLLVAGAVALALGVSVATFGCGAFILCGLVAGVIGGATGWSGYKEKKIQEATENLGKMEITGVLGIKGAASVLINQREAMRAVLDAALCRKHSSPNPNRIAEGSDSVFIETGPAARKGDKLECAAKIVTGSDDVLVGGNKTQYLEIADDKDWWETGAELALAFLGRGSLPGKLGCLALGAAAGMAGEMLGKGFRSLIGYPVNPATGGKVLDGGLDIDFVLPGLLPIEWRRFYSSHDHREHTLHGKGWSVPYEVELHVHAPTSFGDGRLVYVNPQGRRIDMPWLQPGTFFVNTAEGFSLGCTHGGAYEVTDMDLLRYQFGPPSTGQMQASGMRILRLQRLINRTGQWVRLRYQADTPDCIDTLMDHLGRVIRLQYVSAVSNGVRRLKGLVLEQGAPGESRGMLARYEYDAGGQLSRVQGRDERVVRQFRYQDGLMVAQSDAGGFTCFYSWQSPELANGPISEGLAANSPWATPTGCDRRVVRHWTSDGEDYNISYQLDSSEEPIALVTDNLPGQTWATDQLGRTEHWSWDSLYNLRTFTDALGSTWRLEWSDRREVLAATLPGGQTWRWQYNEDGLPALETDPIGRTTRTLWSGNWFAPLAITLPDGGIWRYEYDPRGLCTSRTAPDGTSTEYAWDIHGLLMQTTDAKGGINQWSYEPRGLPVSSTDCSGSTTRYAWDGWGNLRQITDALGQTTLLGHGVNGELLTLALPDGSTQSWQYDIAGRASAHTNAQPRTRYWNYNQRGQLQVQLDEEQRQIQLKYDAAHRLSALVNENGEQYQFEYDAVDRLRQESRVGGQRVTVEYDLNGWPVAVTHWPGMGDDLLQGHSSGVDVNGTTGGQTPEVPQWGDEATRNPLAGSQPRRTVLIRDAVGRLMEKRTGEHHYRYTYDALDQLISATKLKVDADGELARLHTVALQYDVAGNLMSESATNEQTGVTHVLRHEHDVLGNRTQTSLPQIPGRPPQDRALNYLYYGSGHLHQINYSQCDTTDPDALAAHQLISDIERDALHRETARSQGSIATRFALDPVGRRQGAWSRSAAQVTSPYNSQDKAWQRAVQAIGTSEQSPLDGLVKAYAYDKVGELRQTRHSLQGDTAHGYDATGRVLDSLRRPVAEGDLPNAGDERFEYDPAGNILDNSALSALRSRTQHLQGGYVRDNLVRVYEDKRYFYDGHARLIRKRSGRHTDQYFIWDDENNLTEVRTTRRPDTEHQTTQVTRFEYDAIGRRIAKHDSFGTTVFIWEGMRLIEERRGSAIISYVYEPGSYVPMARLDADGEVTDGGGLGTTADPTRRGGAESVEDTERITQSRRQIEAANDPLEARYWEALNSQSHSGSLFTGTDGSSASTKLCEVYYFHTDQVGMPQELSNAQGQLVWQASFKTWGSTVAEEWEIKSLSGNAIHQLDRGDISDKTVQQQNLRFQGQYLDRETELHYNTFRYYDSDIGRFICPDPIGLEGGLNLSLYSPNPIAWIDPWGLSYGSVDFSGSPELFPIKGKQRNVVVIEMQGTRSRDFTQANKEAGFKKTPKGYTWHHVADFDSKSGKTTMQLVKRSAHEATYPHIGSADQYAKHFNVKYDTVEAVKTAQSQGWLKGRKPKC